MSGSVVDLVRHAASWFETSADGFAALLESIGDARLVLIGEASHGTHEFYQARAVGPDFAWSWRNHSLEHEVFRDYISRSDNAFRRAQNQVGLLLANHVLSAVDALISARMTAAARRAASMRTNLMPGRAEIRFSLEF